ncbi:phage terminase large subunit family protein [Escherichia coli]|uniref:phage terminase large subunit family protein n=1 Tax=Escherichia coli TaxID=562 RepID=UPI000DD436D9
MTSFPRSSRMSKKRARQPCWGISVLRAVWPKSIRGSTPKIKGTCQIEKAANESAHFMRFYVPCPLWGGAVSEICDESTPFGLKWEKDSPESVSTSVNIMAA